MQKYAFVSKSLIVKYALVLYFVVLTSKLMSKYARTQYAWFKIHRDSSNHIRGVPMSNFFAPKRFENGESALLYN